MYTRVDMERTFVYTFLIVKAFGASIHMKSTLFRETNILLGYVKTLLVYTCVVIADKFYCRQQYFNMTSDRIGE